MHLVEMDAQGLCGQNLDGIRMGESNHGLSAVLVADLVHEIEHAVEDLPDGFAAGEAKVPGLGHEVTPGGFAVELGQRRSRPLAEVAFDQPFLDDEWLVEASDQWFCRLASSFEW
nr:hypothetical protein [Ferrimicrobium sp.]